MTLTGEDLTGVTTAEFNIRRPDKSELTKTCTVESTTEGIIYYDTIAGDFNMGGNYKIQAYIVIGANQHRSRTVEFKVYNYFDLLP